MAAANPVPRSFTKTSWISKPALHKHPAELRAEADRLLGRLPSWSLAEEVEAPAGSEPSPNCVQRLSRLLERGDVNREDPVVDLVLEIGLLDAGGDETRLVRMGAVSPLSHLDHLRRAVYRRDPAAIELLTDQ